MKTTTLLRALPLAALLAVACGGGDDLGAADFDALCLEACASGNEATDCDDDCQAGCSTWSGASDACKEIGAAYFDCLLAGGATWTCEADTLEPELSAECEALATDFGACAFGES